MRPLFGPRWWRTRATGPRGPGAISSHGVTPDTIRCRTMGGRAVSGAREQGDRARVAAFRIDRHPFADALEGEVDPGPAHRQMPDRETVDADGQPWPVDVDLAAPAVDAQPQACLQQHEDRPRGPSLRDASDGVGDGRLAGMAREAAEQPGQPHVEL